MVTIIAQISIHDRQGYGNYESGFMEIFQQFKGTMVAVDENPTLLEGSWDYTRTVVIQFPTADDAMTWYNSEAYQGLAQHRKDASAGNIIMVNNLTL